MRNFQYTLFMCKWSIVRSFFYLHDCAFDIIFLSQKIFASASYFRKDYVLVLNLCRSRISLPLGCRYIANQKNEEHRISKPLEIQYLELGTAVDLD